MAAAHLAAFSSVTDGAALRKVDISLSVSCPVKVKRVWEAVRSWRPKFNPTFVRSSVWEFPGFPNHVVLTTASLLTKGPLVAEAIISLK